MADLTYLRDASHHDQMEGAQRQCAPCKLCGGKAKIYDAGPGAGYYIRCENHGAFRAAMGCLIGDNRLGGWAYNVAAWWNRLNAPSVGFNPAVHDVLTERHRQIVQEGYTPEGDGTYHDDELAFAAAAYALAGTDRGFDATTIWPWSMLAFKPKTRRENLVRAGALILAEIERLDRVNAKDA